MAYDHKGLTKDIIKTDIMLASQPVGSLPPTSDQSLQQICFYTSIELDSARATIAATPSRPDAQILDLRVLTIRGEFQAAKKILQKSKQINDKATRAEFLLAQAMVVGHEGQWADVVSVCEMGLRLEPVLITRLSLLQCRAMALFEMGHYDSALKDCEAILSQEMIYPSGVPVRYAKVLKVRVLLGLNRVQDAEVAMNERWLQLESEAFLNLDELLTLLRLEIDFHRSKGLPIRDLALSCIQVCDDLGDPLYRALAEVDLYATFQRPPQWLTDSLKNSRERFVKVEGFLKEYQRGEASTSSSRQVLKTVKESDDFPERTRRPQFIFKASRGVVFNLPNRTTHYLPKTTDWERFSELVKGKTLTKEDFFSEFWDQKYFYQKHDGVIRAFLFRLKKKTGIKAESHRGHISFPHVAFS